MPDAPSYGATREDFDRRLREHAAALMQAGLTEDEARLIAVRRLGARPATTPRETVVVLALAAAAAAAIKIPAAFGLSIERHEAFYARNAALFVLPLLTGYFAWKRAGPARRGAWLALAFAAAAIGANAYPFGANSHTQTLTILHLPIALWLVVGIAHAGGRWLTSGGRMDFVRFSGELFIYYVLMALGGGVLTGLTIQMFNAINLDAEWFAQNWLIPCGAMGAVIVGSWLVEAKQSVIESMAPVLTRLFTPLFTVVLLTFLAAMAWTGTPIAVEREALIVFDLLLAVVVGLVLYSISARDPRTPPGPFDALQLVLIASALVVDAVALAAIASRISEFGLSPNRVAALGENLILLINLAGSAWLSWRFLRGEGPVTALERWQVAFLPIYTAWAALVVIAFPPLFAYQ